MGRVGVDTSSPASTHRGELRGTTPPWPNLRRNAQLGEQVDSSAALMVLAG